MIKSIAISDILHSTIFMADQYPILRGSSEYGKRIKKYTDEGKQVSYYSSLHSIKKTNKKEHRKKSLKYGVRRKSSSLTSKSYSYNVAYIKRSVSDESQGTLKGGARIVRSKQISPKKKKSHVDRAGASQLDMAKHSPSTIAWSDSDDGMNIDPDHAKTLSQVQLLELHEQLLYSTFNKDFNKQILACKHGKILVCNISDRTITDCTKVAGEIASLSSCQEFIAVGSTEAQLFHLGKNMQRTLLCREDDPIETCSDSRVLLSFIVGSSLLATAKLGESKVELWAIPQDETPNVIFRQPSDPTMQTSGTTISLASLPNSSGNLFAVLSKETSTTNRVSLTLYDWKLCTAIRSVAITHQSETDMMLSNLISVDARHCALGIGKELKICDIQELNEEKIRTKLMRDEVTTLSCDKISGSISAGMDSGVVILDCNLDASYVLDFKEKRKVVSCVGLEGGTILVTFQNGTIEQLSKGKPAVSQPAEKFSDIGMKLQAEGIIANLEKIQPNVSDGFIFEKQGIGIQFPEDELIIPTEFAIGTYSHRHIFQFPDGIIQVSPIVWLCSFPPDKVLDKPVRITLPHCVDYNSEDRGSLIFLKANHADKVNLCSSEENYIKFDAMKEELFSLENRSGTIEDDHFCFFCIGLYVEKDVIGKVNYAITLVKPLSYKKGQKDDLYCVFHYDLRSCKSEIEDQFKSGYQFSSHTLHFSPDNWSDGGIKLSIDRRKAEEDGWLVTLESHDVIPTKEVNFFSFTNRNVLREACRTDKSHPPRFKVGVSQRETRVQSSRIKLMFEGAREYHAEEVQLICEYEPTGTLEGQLRPLVQPFSAQSGGET